MSNIIRSISVFAALSYHLVIFFLLLFRCIDNVQVPYVNVMLRYIISFFCCFFVR